MTQFEVQQTDDGSLTIYDKLHNETFHSVYGARNESLYVFIEQGLKKFCNQPSLTILEVGLGTGLNAYLTFFNKAQNQTIYYEAIELYPLTSELVQIIASSLENQTIYLQLMQAPWNKEQPINKDFVVYKRNEDILNIKFSKVFDLIYFDAFSPKAQPELWTLDVFQNLFQHLNSGGALVTYASSGIVKQNLRSVGFKVERLQGPPHKHHMVRVWKI
ncbi:MAG: tRNA (5-methylaminomethyl-2-thiouridine)(34)-methyltransferase MnmD [Bacteroidales bacterium]|nr:tRNA (5-methylaminomethyl-2-thiouridine)(34)-methyltransferase MnmD [Bacteroidales bacterium]